jgi:hypothetical protein
MADGDHGISIEGGVITLEPPTSKTRFWIREVGPRLSWGLLMKDPYISEEIVSPLYIVVWNSDRTVEFYREGPYKGSRQRTALESLRTEINRVGLEEFLFNYENRRLRNAASRARPTTFLTDSRTLLEFFWRFRPWKKPND